MTRLPVQESYTLREIHELLGISKTIVTGFIRAGFVAPERGVRNEYRFSFQDIVLLRTAQALQASDIPQRRIVRAMAQLRKSLPEELPLAGLRITAVGNDVAVHERGAKWAPESGQLLMDFEIAKAGATVTILPAAARAEEGDSAEELIAAGQEVESTDQDAAEASYRKAMEIAPDEPDAYLNLGALMCEAGRCDEAVQLYLDAIERCPPTAALHFNFAIALEDQGSKKAALEQYEQCLKLSPDLADAHFNAARLHEAFGHAQMALRHFSAYRRLKR